MLQTLLEYRDGMKEFYKNYNIRACIDTLYKSWAEIITENIKGAWNKIPPLSSEQ